uniref:PMS1 protein homolog 1 isoform X1 n=1 Tax=Myxine glutinosa TaxID=7769 RepID=UPI00358FD67D
MKQLPAETVRLLSSSQVITSVTSVVKELLENSLDANATNVDVKLENFGLDRIEVRDNGDGIAVYDTPHMGVRYYTSKINTHEDLDVLTTYGFRGEALGSTCAISDVSITTRTVADDISTVYTLDHKGEVTAMKPSHLGQGTTVTVTKLFKNLPVRKQLYSGAKKCKDELRRLEELLIAYGVMKPGVRLSLTHNKMMVWQKAAASDHRSALLLCLGSNVVNSLLPVQHEAPALQLSIVGFVPRPGSDRSLTSTSGTERSLLAINGRPVYMKELLKMMRQFYNKESGDSRSYNPVFFLSMTVPSSSVDVNFTPDKTQVLLHDKDERLAELEKMLESVNWPLSDDDHFHMASCADASREKVTGERCERVVMHKVTPIRDVLSCGDDGSKEHLTTTGSLHNSARHKSDFSLPKDRNLRPLLTTPGTGKDCFIINMDNNELETNGGAKDGELQRMPQQASEELTAEQWSRGVGLAGTDGHPLSPVTILTSGEGRFQTEANFVSAPDKVAHPFIPNKRGELLTGRAVVAKEDGTPSFDIVGSRVVRRPQEAFQMFQNKRRTQLESESFGGPAEDIESQLCNDWEQLDEKSRQRYETKASKEMHRYGQQVREAVVLGTPSPKPPMRTPGSVKRRKTPLVGQPLLTGFVQKQHTSSERETLIKTHTVSIALNVQRLAEGVKRLSEEDKQRWVPTGIVMVGRLGGRGAWVARDGRRLLLVNHFRLEETMLYQNLIKSHALPLEPLGTPVALSESVLGGSRYMDALCALKTEQLPPDFVPYIMDQRLVNNGFRIRKFEDSSGSVVGLELAALATCVAFYGLADLREVLEAIVDQHANSAHACRPRKIINYLQGEAVRMARQVPARLPEDEIIEKLQRMSNVLPADCRRCLHGLPFFHHFADLPKDSEVETKGL